MLIHLNLNLTSSSQVRIYENSSRSIDQARFPANSLAERNFSVLHHLRKFRPSFQLELEAWLYQNSANNLPTSKIPPISKLENFASFRAHTWIDFTAFPRQLEQARNRPNFASFPNLSISQFQQHFLSSPTRTSSTSRQVERSNAALTRRCPQSSPKWLVLPQASMDYDLNEHEHY